MKWTITQLKCYPEKQGHANVVFQIDWMLTHTVKTETKVFQNIRVLVNPRKGPFIEYDILTEDHILGWLFDDLGAAEVALIETQIAAEVDKALNPSVIAPALPWELS